MTNEEELEKESLTSLMPMSKTPHSHRFVVKEAPLIEGDGIKFQVEDTNGDPCGHGLFSDITQANMWRDELNALDDEIHVLKVSLRRLIKASLGVATYTETEDQKKSDLRLRTAISLAQKTLKEDCHHE